MHVPCALLANMSTSLRIHFCCVTIISYIQVYNTDLLIVPNFGRKPSLKSQIQPITSQITLSRYYF